MCRDSTPRILARCLADVKQIFDSLIRGNPKRYVFALVELAEQKLFGAEIFDLVAEGGGAFEFEFFGGLAHFGF